PKSSHAVCPGLRSAASGLRMRVWHAILQFFLPYSLDLFFRLHFCFRTLVIFRFGIRIAQLFSHVL
ncbi:hypothetical protein, partial [Celerinatantimonas sp. YJH-8]|uniref:hypothetical protein n=1 Tax=Celerinatantimonas sp. YJH-8 TaxID=3228714 RepID=UPI0038C02CD4